MSLKRKFYKDGELQRKKIRLQSECNILTLPDELVIKIFSYLRYKDLLMGAAIVCTEWRRLTLATELWNRIDQTPYINTETLMHLLKQSNHIQFIRLYECWFFKDSVISEIAKQEMLKTLILARCKLLSPEVFVDVAKCRALQHLDLSELSVTDKSLKMIVESCTKLTYLNLEGCGQVTGTGLVYLIRYCHQMKQLILNRCKKLTNGAMLALAALHYPIERLEIADCGITERGLNYFKYMPQLKHINASRNDSICDSMAHIFSNLKSLHLVNLEEITNDGVLTILRNNPNLEQLVLGSMAINDIAMEYISNSSCRSTLTILNIAHCAVSDVGVSLILRSCPKLKTVTYSGGPKTKRAQKRLQC